MNIQYMLRRVLCPWNVEGIVAETIEYCRKSSIAEIMWITESSGAYHELLRIEGIRALLPGLLHAKEKTEAAGLIFSVNPLTTIGHGEYGNPIAQIHPEMERMVDYTGKMGSAACPLGAYWRNLMLETFALYAETKPRHLWLEDDFRYFGHGSVGWGCFCDLHLEEFARRTRMRRRREELVATLLTPGDPPPERGAWFDFLSATLAETASLIAEKVHAISPGTTLCWMATNPAIVDLGGIKLAELMDGCANGKHAGIRMNSSRYTEKNARDLLITDEHLKKFLPALPPQTMLSTEVESIPHTLYTKSASGIAAHIEWASILGVPAHTLNIFDYLGSPMNQVPKYGRMLAERKSGFESFASAFESCAPAGVGILHRPEMCRFTHTTEGKHVQELCARECGFADSLRAFGMPVVFGGESRVTAATGQALRAFSRQELREIFSRGVLLDGVALGVLQELGLGDWAGVGIASRLTPQSRAIGPEALTDPDFGGGKFHYMWTWGLWPEFVLQPVEGARIISRILDVDENFLQPGFVLCENALGGRVAVCPYDLGGSGLDPLINREPGWYYSEYRKTMIRRLVEWLGNTPPPLLIDVDGWVLPHLAVAEDRIVAAAMNIGDDEWESVGMRIAVVKPVREIRWADIGGSWVELPASEWRMDNGAVDLCLDAIVPSKRTIAVEVRV